MFRMTSCVALVILAAAAPGCGQERVFFGSLHSHTSYSDGSGLPADAYERARDQGKCDFWAITEHNHGVQINPKSPRTGQPPIGLKPELYNGASNSLVRAAERAMRPGRFVALYGQEFSSISSGNHACVFDIPAVITAQNGHYDQLVAWLQDPTHFDTSQQAAIVQFNHPAKDLREQHTEYGADDFGSASQWHQQMGALACTIEIVNGPGLSRQDHQDVPSAWEDAYRHYLSQGFRLAPSADQDNHFLTWGTLTTARTGVIATTLDKASLMQAIRARHVYASTDNNLRVIVRVNGGLCGDILPRPALGTALQITLSIKDDDEPNAEYRVDAFQGDVGGPQADAIQVFRADDGDGDYTFDDVQYTGPKQYVFFRVRQPSENGDNDTVWTAPVWFTDPVGGATPAQPSGPDETAFVASKRGAVFHTDPNCSGARAIRPANLITGHAATIGRSPHEGCPR